MIEPKQTINQRYQLQKKLGERPACQTWLALDLETNCKVVVKLLTFGGKTHWNDLKLFEREELILKELNHRFIPKYLDKFSLEHDVQLYGLVQEYIPGSSLQTLLDRGKSFDELTVKQIAWKLLNILSYLHRLNPQVLHRDIKPSNIILSENGHVYLVDFGSIQNGKTKGTSFTVVGTYGYTPMEQFGGVAVAASDLYALGATMIHLLTGVSPAELTQKDLQILFCDRVKISQHFANWLEKITEPALEDRFSSANKALEALGHLCELANNSVISNLERHRLEAEAQKWKNSGQKNTFLLSSKRLQEVRVWQRKEPEKYPLSKQVKVFIARSIQNHRRQSLKVPGYVLAGFLAILGMPFLFEEPVNKTQSAIQDVVQNCQVKEECYQNIEALEKLVEAGESFEFHNLSHASLEFADFADANFADANLADANLRSTDFYRADLENTDLEDANLAYTNLHQANLEAADLEEARLFDVDLHSANLESANLESATLKFANLADANLEEANLENTNFIRVKNLTNSQIKSACNWDKAVYKNNWDDNKRIWIADDKANQQYIEQLKQDKASARKQSPDCSKWN